MRMRKDKLTGALDDANIVFSNNDYQFTLMAANKEEPECKLESSDGFIYGTSYYNKRVGLFIGESKLCISKSLLYTPLLYVQSETAWNKNIDISKFQRIVFSGGTLNNLFETRFYQDQLQFDNDKITINYPTYKKQYSFRIKGTKCNITIGILPNDSCDDTSLNYHNEAYICLEFEEEQPLSDVRMHYKYINQVVSVMTHRKENHFDYIFVEQSGDAMMRMMNRCLVHLWENDNAQMHSNCCATFDFLGDSLPRLLSLVYNSKDKEASYSLGFIPQNNDDSRIITDDTIRSISAAIECEYQLSDDLTINYSEELDTICELARNAVIKYREEYKNSTKLSPDTYNSIFKSISFWKITTAEKAYALYERFKNNMESYFSFRQRIAQEDIQRFVQYRNSISHGSYRKMTKEIRDTAFAMKVLVYYSLLHRIGIPDEKLNELNVMGVVF